MGRRHGRDRLRARAARTIRMCREPVALWNATGDDARSRADPCHACRKDHLRPPGLAFLNILNLAVVCEEQYLTRRLDGRSVMTLDASDIWFQVQRGLRAFIARRVANDAEVEDILQEVFLRMHRRLDSLKDPRRLVSWVFQITRHAIADYYRALERQREVPAGLAVDMEAVHPATAQPLTGLSADSGQLRQELAACLSPMIARLSTQYREAVTLVELEGLTQNAAAKRLGLSVSGMKSRVQRGRQQLKRLLDECCVIQLDRRHSVAEYAVRDPQCNPCSASPDQKPSRAR